MDAYQLEKSVWTIDDFAQMGWYDCLIRAFSFSEDCTELLLDIDYILKWVLDEENQTFSFWIAPATLVFSDISTLAFNTDTPELTIDEISFEKSEFNDGQKQWYNWNISLHYGEINFEATDFVQYIRANPILVNQQLIPLVMRNGISFAKTSI